MVTLDLIGKLIISYVLNRIQYTVFYSLHYEKIVEQIVIFVFFCFHELNLLM